MPDHRIEAYAHADPPLIEPFHLDQLQPASYDLLLERQLAFPGPNSSPWAMDTYLLYPGKLVLGCTQERVRLPSFVSGTLMGRSGNARRGLQIEAAGHVDPGYCGVLVLEISNRSDSPIMLCKGMGIAKIVFNYLEAACRTPYSAERNRHQYAHGPTQAALVD